MYIGICDDCEAVHQQIREYIRENFQEQTTEEIVKELFFVDFMDGAELLKYDGQMDILFLDIDMPKLDGIQAGKRLRRKQFLGKIILLTSVKERATEGYEIEAYRYLPKPIDRKKLVQYIHEIIQNLAGMETVNLHAGGETYPVKQQNISYIMRLPHSSQTEIIVGKSMFRSKIGISEWMQILDGKLFCRTHRGYIVNLKMAEYIENNRLILASGEIIPVSRREKAGVKKKFMEFYADFR